MKAIPEGANTHSYEDMLHRYQHRLESVEIETTDEEHARAAG